MGPQPQDNLQRATESAFEALESQTTAQLAWLGARAVDSCWCLPVLGDEIHVDLGARRVTTPDGTEVGPAWRILVLHYLAVVSQPDALQPQITFADLPSARTYASVYRQRVIARLCATAGRDRERLRTAAERLGGREANDGDAAFDFDVFPRLRVRLIWHAGDDEFPPSATILLPANIEAYFCTEDIVVLSELLVARLGGRSF